MRKRSNIKGILLQVLLLIPIMSYATEDVEIMVSGSGVNKETAVNIALRSALEQSYGAFVSTSTKTLNDKLVSDEIVSLSRGNIKNYNILSEKQLTNGHWYVLVKATVNVNKLIKYVQGEGSSVEVDMRAFGAKVQMEELNRKAERKIIEDLIAEIEAIDLWDYSLELDEPSLSGNKYVISGVVNVQYNNNTNMVIDLMSAVFSELDVSSHPENRVNGGAYYKYICGPTLLFNCTLRNPYNNGLLRSNYYGNNGRQDDCGFEPRCSWGEPTSATFLTKIRFTIEPLGIRIDGNNTWTRGDRENINRSGIYQLTEKSYGLNLICNESDNMYYTYIINPYEKKTIVRHNVHDVIFKIHFKKELSREEAMKINRVTIQPL